MTPAMLSCSRGPRSSLPPSSGPWTPARLSPVLPVAHLVRVVLMAMICVSSQCLPERSEPGSVWRRLPVCPRGGPGHQDNGPSREAASNLLLELFFPYPHSVTFHQCVSFCVELGSLTAVMCPWGRENPSTQLYICSGSIVPFRTCLVLLKCLPPPILRGSLPFPKVSPMIPEDICLGLGGLCMKGCATFLDHLLWADPGSPLPLTFPLTGGFPCRQL